MIGYEDNIKSLKNMVEVQGQHGNWDFDDYMLGLFNGMEFALSIMEEREPIFRGFNKDHKCNQ